MGVSEIVAMNWALGRKTKKERRRSPRLEVSGLDAVYWDGSTTNSHAIVEISLHGVIVDTPVDWCRGTLIRLAVRRSDAAPEAAIGPSIWSRVVRNSARGMCIELLFFHREELKVFQQFLEQSGVNVYGGEVKEPKAEKRTGAA